VALPSITVNVDADTAKALAQLSAFAATADKLLSSIDAKSFGDFWDKNKSDKEAKDAGRDNNRNWNDGWNKSEKREAPKRRSAFRRELLKWGSIIAAFGETIGVALYGAAGAVVSLGSSLLSAVSASAALVPIGVALAGAFGAVAIGLVGVGDALGAVKTGFSELVTEGEITAETMEAIEKSLENLAPNAALFVTAFGNILPLFREIRLEVQDALFAGLGDELVRLGGPNGFIDQMGTAFERLAGVVNTSFIEIIGAVEGADLPGIFMNLETTLGNVLSALAPLTTAFFNFVEIATPFAEQLSAQFLSWAESLAEFTGSAEGLESISGFLERAVESLQSWLDLIGITGRVIGSLLRIASEEGDSLIDKLTGVLTTFNDWINTAEGENAVLTFLETSSEILLSLQPVLEGLVGAFDVLVTDGAVERFAELAELLGELLPLLAGVLNVISRTGILNTFAQALVAIGNALPFEQLGELASIIGGVLATAVEALTPVLDILGEAIGVAAEAFGEMFVALEETGVFDSLSVALQAVAEVILLLFEALAPLLPVIGELAGVLLVSLADILLSVAEALIPVIESLTPIILLVAELLTAIMPLIEIALIPLQLQIALLSEAFQLFYPLLDLLIEPLATLGGSFEDTSALLAEWGEVFEEWKEIVTEVIDVFLDKISDMVDTFTSSLTTIGDLWDTIWNAILNVTRTVMNAVSNFITSVMNSIRSTISSIWNSIKSIVSGALSAISGSVSSVFNSIKSTISSILGGIKSTISTIWNGIKSTITTVITGILNTIRTLFGSITGIVTGALAGVANAIAAPFRAAIAGVQAAVDRIKSIGAGIGNFVSNLNPFARGGIVFGPTPALIGEAGAEAVIPLTRPLSQVDSSVRAMAALLRGDIAGMAGTVTNNAGASSTNNSRQMTNNFTINDRTGNAETTAQKVINRIAVGL